MKFLLKEAIVIRCEIFGHEDDVFITVVDERLNVLSNFKNKLVLQCSVGFATWLQFL